MRVSSEAPTLGRVSECIVIIIFIIQRRDFGGIMSNDCKNTLQTQNSTSATQQNEQSIYQIQTAAELVLDIIATTASTIK